MAKEWILAHCIVLMQSLCERQEIRLGEPWRLSLIAPQLCNGGVGYYKQNFWDSDFQRHSVKIMQRGRGGHCMKDRNNIFVS